MSMVLPEFMKDGSCVGIPSGWVSETEEPVEDEGGDDGGPAAEHEDDDLMQKNQPNQHQAKSRAILGQLSKNFFSSKLTNRHNN